MQNGLPAWKISNFHIKETYGSVKIFLNSIFVAIERSSVTFERRKMMFAIQNEMILYPLEEYI